MWLIWDLVERDLILVEWILIWTLVEKGLILVERGLIVGLM